MAALANLEDQGNLGLVPPNFAVRHKFLGKFYSVKVGSESCVINLTLQKDPKTNFVIFDEPRFFLPSDRSNRLRSFLLGQSMRNNVFLE